MGVFHRGSGNVGSDSHLTGDGDTPGAKYIGRPEASSTSRRTRTFPTLRVISPSRTEVIKAVNGAPQSTVSEYTVTLGK